MQKQVPVVDVETLVIKTGNKQHFRGKTWAIVFLEGYLQGLNRAEKASLFTLILESSPRRGLLRAHREVLRGIFSRAHVVNVVRQLSLRGIVLRLGDWLYLNPAVAYSGSASEHQRAVERWQELQSEAGRQQETLEEEEE